MMEKASVSYSNYQKKIISYLDGSLSPEEHSEFEAFVRTHPEFEASIKAKENELFLLKSLIPSIQLSRESEEALEREMHQSVLNLLKERPQNLWEQTKIKFEEWFNR